MWTAHDYKPTMTTNAPPVARPYTPPDMDSDSDSPRHYGGPGFDAATTIQDSGYFGDSTQQPLSAQRLHAWSRPDSPAPDRSHPPSRIPQRRRPNGHKPGNSTSASFPTERPFTPTNARRNDHVPQYPSTPPDSARMSVPRTQSYEDASPSPGSPLQSRLWASSPPIDRTLTSPVQNALFSCLNNLERLIASSQPDDDQMEYIVEQFEAISSHLSAPEAQSRTLDEHLFSELDLETGETSPDGLKSPAPTPALSKQEAEAYVYEVGKFIEGVQKHAADMKERLDEAKQVNELNVHIIADLKRELRVRKAAIDDLSTALCESHKTIADVQEKLYTSEIAIAKLQEQLAAQAASGEDEDATSEDESEARKTRPGLMASISGALDFVSDLLYEW